MSLAEREPRSSLRRNQARPCPRTPTPIDTTVLTSLDLTIEFGVHKSLNVAPVLVFLLSIVPLPSAQGERLATSVSLGVAETSQSQGIRILGALQSTVQDSVTVTTMPALSVPAQSSTLSSLPSAVPDSPSYSLRKAQDLGKFKVTFYWLVEEDNYQGKKTSPLYASDGKLVGRFTPQFIKDFQNESCAMLSDGRIISYLKGTKRCRIVDMPIGADGYTLTELKSVAVDPTVIPIGSALFIRDAEDLPVTDSFVHDGVFYAQDVGSTIKGNRIDVYLGPKSNMDLFRSTAMCRTGGVEVYLLQ